MKRIPIYIVCLAALLCGCTDTGKNKPTIFVSIAPLKSIIHDIVGDDFDINIIVPAGASPESFEPTPRQFIALNNAEMVFSVGLIDFEQNLLSKISNKSKLVSLNAGIEPIAGSCSHNHEHGHHHHGVDPHIWSSPSTLKTMSHNAFKAIMTAYPDSIKYAEAYTLLSQRLDALDETVAQYCAAAKHKYFIVYHPALTYLARDYGLEQIAIEHDGKEPSVKRLAQIIDRARKDGIRKIFYQSQFPKHVVEALAADIGAQTVEIDPLREDAIENIEYITRLITE